MRETGAYIIVSDVHLGSKECNYNEFCYFLEWIRDLENKPKIIKCKDKEVTIKNPSKIILLGIYLNYGIRKILIEITSSRTLCDRSSYFPGLIVTRYM